MIKDLTAFYSKNALNMKRSEIRDLLKVTRQPDMISFAGGLPAPETFPVKDLEDISCIILREKGALALQYGPTEGEWALREEIAKWMARENPQLGLKTFLSRQVRSKVLTLWAESSSTRRTSSWLNCPHTSAACKRSQPTEQK